MHGKTPTDANATLGADTLADVLAAHDIRTVFALAGASFTFLLRALEQRGVTVISTRHESATVAAADGYARVTGKPGVALIISDQGVPNAIGGLASAYYASSPVIVLVARLPLAWEEAEGEVDADANALVAPVSKWARTIPSAERIGEYAYAALKWATFGRPGPVVLSFVQDILAEPVAPSGALAPLPRPARPALDRAALDEMLDLLAKAERPILIAGSEAARDDAGPACRALAAMGIPVLGNGLGRGLAPEDEVSGFPWPYAQICACEADLVIFAGARPTRRFGFALPPRLAPDAAVIQIDSRPEFLHRNRRMSAAGAADIGVALRQLADGAAAAGLSWSTDWLVEALKPRAAAVRALAERRTGPIHPVELAAEIESLSPPDAIMVGDGADIQNWAYGVIRAKSNPVFLEHYPLGSMGIGLPMAIGAAAAAKEMAGEAPARPVVMLTGDGSFGFYPGELQSAAQAGLNLTIVIANDAAWGTELHGQRAVLGDDYNTRLQPSRYERIAGAFDLPGYFVADRADLRPQLARALADPATAVVNVMIDEQAGAQLKSDRQVNMILFSEVTQGIAALKGAEK
jgi:acetolactate synthase-1/2/3 large subunit